MYPNSPASKRAFTTSSPLRRSTSFLPKSVASCFPSASTIMPNTLRRSPRTTALTVPLTGDANFTSGQFLLINKASPALTLSPSFTTTLGVTPTKSVGARQYLPFDFSCIFFFSAAPASFMSKPLRNLITLTIIIKGFVKVSKKTLQNYEFLSRI